jgi:hypothetical protein
MSTYLTLFVTLAEHGETKSEGNCIICTGFSLSLISPCVTEKYKDAKGSETAELYNIKNQILIS